MSFLKDYQSNYGSVLSSKTDPQFAFGYSKGMYILFCSSIGSVDDTAQEISLFLTRSLTGGTPSDLKAIDFLNKSIEVYTQRGLTEFANGLQKALDVYNKSKDVYPIKYYFISKKNYILAIKDILNKKIKDLNLKYVDNGNYLSVENKDNYILGFGIGRSSNFVNFQRIQDGKPEQDTYASHLVKFPNFEYLIPVLVKDWKIISGQQLDPAEARIRSLERRRS